MSDDGLVLIDDEDVPLAVNTLLGVVVGDGLLQAEGDVEVRGLLHEGLRVGGASDLPGPRSYQPEPKVMPSWMTVQECLVSTTPEAGLA